MDVRVLYFPEMHDSSVARGFKFSNQEDILRQSIADPMVERMEFHAVCLSRLSRSSDAISRPVEGPVFKHYTLTTCRGDKQGYPMPKKTTRNYTAQQSAK